MVYPDDMPENWLDVMRQDMFDMVISPIHDKDKNPTGEAKKAHYHILVSAGTAWITMNKLAEWGRKLKGIAKPQKCSNPKGMVRYFTHIDNPEKYQYNKSEIQVIGQYDIEPFSRRQLEKSERFGVKLCNSSLIMTSKNLLTWLSTVLFIMKYGMII